MSTIKIATLNINGITARTRVGMLADFIRQHDFDIVFAQEVTSTEALNVCGYDTHLNIGTFMRGTAILARSTLHLTVTGINFLPSGRAMAANIKGIRLLKVYAPSGTARRSDREQFYTTELPRLLHDGPTNFITGGDFNCVLHPDDTTGHFQPSRALTEIIRGLALKDAWKQNHARPTYRHHSPSKATRLDRFTYPRNYRVENLNRNSSTCLQGPLCGRDPHYCTRHRIADSTGQMEV